MSKYNTVKPNRKRKRRTPNNLTRKEKISLTPLIVKVGVENRLRDIRNGIQIRYKNVCNGLKVYCPTTSCSDECIKVDTRFQ